MARGSINLIEKHVEKAVLGLAGAFLLAMLFMYLVRSPNKLEYGGQAVGPDELAAAIERDARALQEAVQRAKAPATEVPDYSEALKRQHAGGVLNPAEEGRAVPTALPLATDFGMPVPSLSKEEEASGEIVLVTPLQPSVPVARTGRNLVLRKPPRLGEALSGDADADEDEALEPVELPWVTVAAYFDRGAQRDAMTKAKYATYRSRVYVTGVDVQRQEMQANGEYTDWQDVTDAQAMPRVDIPAPEFDELSGAVLNRADVDQAYALVKGNQSMLAQPPFYQTLAGGAWKMPPLEGHLDEDEPQVASSGRDEEDSGDKTKRRPTGGRRIGTGSTIDVGGAGQSGAAAGRRAAASNEEKREARQEARDAIEEAKTAYRDARDGEARSLAQRVLDNEHARGGDKKFARLILKSIDAMEELARRQPTAAAATRQQPNITETEIDLSQVEISGSSTGARSSRTPSVRQTATPEGDLVTHPEERDQIAVWFNDDTVGAGKTYRYRMRVRLWNRYVGQMRALRTPEQAKRCELVGDWSLPGPAITVAPGTHFFVGSASTTRDSARVDVWKWRKGYWLKQSFSVGVGDVIGGVEQVETGILDRETLREVREDVDFGTGAIVLDLRFDEPVIRRDAGSKGEFTLREADSLVLVYLDPADGQVKERTQVVDKYHPLLAQLKGDDS